MRVWELCRIVYRLGVNWQFQPEERSSQIANSTSLPVLSAAGAESIGRFWLRLFGRHRFVAFPSGTMDEAQRIFTPILRRLVLDANWTQIGCDEARRKRTIRELEVQIGNSSQRVSIQLHQSSHRETKRRISIMNVKAKWCVSAGIVVMAVVTFVIAGSHRASAAPPRPASNVEVPKFVVDPSWPHIPNGGNLGHVSS